MVDIKASIKEVSGCVVRQIDGGDIRQKTVPFFCVCVICVSKFLMIINKYAKTVLFFWCVLFV